MKICKTCIYVQTGGTSYFCGHPEVGRNPVDGWKSNIPIFCADARSPKSNDTIVCGIEGRLWEPKP